MKKIILLTSILFLTITTSLFAQHPNNLQSTNITSNSVDLSWDESMCSLTVNVRYRITGSGGGGWINDAGVSSPYLLTGLNPSTSYEFYVKCVGIAGWSSAFFFTTLSASSSSVSIDTAFITQPILCYDENSSSGMQVVMNQPATPITYSCIVGYFPFGNSYFASYLNTNQTTTGVINLTGLNANFDYCIRIVDSVAYYNANNGFSSGTSSTGVLDEWCSITFSQPAQLSASTSVVSGNLCAGDCIAAEDLLISGGTGPYSFTVNGGAPQNLPTGDSTYSFLALCSDNYDVIVTDINGCSTLPGTTNFIIAPIPVIAPQGSMSLFNLNGYNISCNGESDGSITALATGGTGTFTYSIDGINFQTNNLFSGLSSGAYTIIYKDGNGCIATEDFILNEPPALFGTANVSQDVDCYNVNTGEITFTVDPLQPGVPVYQYSVDNGINYQASNIFPNLLGNLNYDILVMDNNTCQFTSTVYLAEPTEIIYTTTLSNYNNFEVSCIGLSDGTIEFTSTIGGLAPYEYSTDNGTTFNPVTLYSGLPSGIYNLKVKDNIGCIISSVVSLDDPGLFSLPFVVSSVVDCPGDCNGAISINPSNSAGQVVYSLLSVATQTTPYFSGLCGDITNGSSYTLNAVDDNGCIAPTTTISLTEPSAFLYTTSSGQDDFCSQSTGQASITVNSGGTGNLLYLWDDADAQSSSVAINLASGTYSVLVTDQNNCNFTESVTVLADEGFTVSFTTVSPCLGDSSGSATVSATGISPLSYQWSDANGIIAGETSPTISGMPIGTYSLEIIDNTTCVVVGSVDITPTVNPIVIDSLVITNSSCFGIDDAQIEIFSSGGQAPFTFSNSNGLNFFSNPVFGMLSPDTYGIQAIDGNGCFDDTSITLSYPGELEIDSTVFTHVSCFGLDDGAVQNIQFVGGTGPFEFSIDGNTTQSYMQFIGLDPGPHTVEVFDINNCASSDIIIIVEPTLFEVETIVSDWNNYQIMCNGAFSGYVNIESSGGTTPYFSDNTIFWNTLEIDSILPGYFNVTVQDANGCTYQDSILFQEPSPIQHNFITTHINCAELNNGSVIDSVYGGVGSSTTYSYLWLSGDTTYSLDNLSMGTYKIIVTDENGCIDTGTVVINDDNVFQADVGTIVNVGCFDDCDGELNVTVLGGIPFTGTSSYNYLWNDFLGQTSETAYGLCVDTSLSNDYECIVSDAVGCSDTVYFTLTQPSELQVDVLITDSIDCKGFSDGELKAIVAGGQPSYTYTWSNGVTFNGGISSTISSLPLGTYKVIVEDANTCRDTFEIYLGEPTLVAISIDHYDISCFGDSDGKIEVLGTGGTSFESTYSYTLYSGTTIISSVLDYESGSISQTPFVFSNLGPGNYYVIVEDRNMCSATSLSVEITEPFEPLTVLVESVNETCLYNDGIIIIKPQGGSQLFNYFINGSPTLNNSNIVGGNPPGLYTIQVLDTRGCEISDVSFIKDYRKIFLPDTVSSIDTIICLGQSIVIDVDESSELTYSWNDGVETGDRIIIPEVILPYGKIDSIVYTLTIIDTNNCSQENIVTVHLNSIDPMLESDPGIVYGDFPVVLAGDDINLYSENNNVVEFIWQWSSNSITNTIGLITIQELSKTDWYYLNVKDNDGCLGYDSIKVVVGVKPYEAFTPNGDNINDTWTPLDIRSYENSSVQVFNRWGGLVFDKSGSNYPVNGWDGTNEGDELPVGTYYYIIDLNTGDSPQTGPITIIR